MEASTSLVPHPATGEALDLATASDEQIVEYVEALAAAKEFVEHCRAAAGTELIERLDRSGKWTRQVKIGDEVWEIRSSSPTAGTEEWDEAALIEAVESLRRQGVIDESAVGRTIRHMVTLTYVTGSAREAQKLLEAAKQDVRMPEVNHERKVAKTGVNALLKIPDAAEVIEACKRVSEPKTAAERKVTVKPKVDA